MTSQSQCKSTISDADSQRYMQLLNKQIKDTEGENEFLCYEIRDRRSQSDITENELRECKREIDEKQKLLEKKKTMLRNLGETSVEIPSDINQIRGVEGPDGFFLYFEDPYGNYVKIDPTYNITIETESDRKLAREKNNQILARTLPQLRKKYVDGNQPIIVHGKEVYLNNANEFRINEEYGVIIYGKNREFVFEPNGKLRKHNIDSPNVKIAKETIRKLQQEDDERYARELREYRKSPQNKKLPSGGPNYWYDESINRILFGEGKNMKILDIYGNEIILGDCPPIGENELTSNKPIHPTNNKDENSENSSNIKSPTVVLPPIKGKDGALYENTNETFAGIKDLSKKDFRQVSDFFGSVLLGNNPQKVSKILNTILQDPTTKLSFSNYTTGTDQVLYINIQNQKSKIKRLIFPLNQNKEQLAIWYPHKFEMKDQELVLK